MDTEFHSSKLPTFFIRRRKDWNLFIRSVSLLRVMWMFPAATQTRQTEKAKRP
jgi:hypothetical protein